MLKGQGRRNCRKFAKEKQRHVEGRSRIHTATLRLPRMKERQGQCGKQSNPPHRVRESFLSMKPRDAQHNSQNTPTRLPQKKPTKAIILLDIEPFNIKRNDQEQKLWQNEAAIWNGMQARLPRNGPRRKKQHTMGIFTVPGFEYTRQSSTFVLPSSSACFFVS